MNHAEKLALLLIRGASDQQLMTMATGTLRLSPQEAQDAIGEARRQITLAADYRRDAELGLAIQRLNDLYQKASTAGEPKTALAIQKELNRLLGLYASSQSTAGDAGSGDDLAAELLDAIDEHLRPLLICGPDVHPVEVCRLVALMAMRR